MAQQGQTCDEELITIERRLAGAAADKEFAFMPPALVAVLHTLVLAIAHTRLMLRRGCAAADETVPGKRPAPAVRADELAAQLEVSRRTVDALQNLLAERVRQLEAARAEADPLRRGLRVAMGMSVTATDEQIVAAARALFEERHAAESAYETGVKMWRQAHPDYHGMLPPTRCDLVAWLLTERDTADRERARAERDALLGTEQLARLREEIGRADALRESLRRALEMPANALDSAIIARAAEMRNVLEAAHAGIDDARGELASVLGLENDRETLTLADLVARATRRIAVLLEEHQRERTEVDRLRAQVGEMRTLMDTAQGIIDGARHDLALALGCSAENTLANLVASACWRISGQAARIAEIERLGEEADQDAARLRVRVSRALGIAGERSDETIVTAIGNLNMALEAWRRAAAEMLGFPQAGKIDADDAMVTALRRVVESAQAPGPKERGALISALGWGSTFGVYTFDDIVRGVRDQRIGRDREREAARKTRERLDSLVSILRAAEPETVVAVAQDRMAEVVSLRARVDEARRELDGWREAQARARSALWRLVHPGEPQLGNGTVDQLIEAAGALLVEARGEAAGALAEMAEHRERWARVQPLIRALHAWELHAINGPIHYERGLLDAFEAWQKAEAAALDAEDGPVAPPRQPDDPGVEPEASAPPNLHDTLALAADVAIARIEEAGLAVEIVAMEEGSLGLAGDVVHTVRVRIPRDVIEATRAARKGAS